MKKNNFINTQTNKNKIISNVKIDWNKITDKCSSVTSE
jgi:hypothetical protein